MTRVGRHLRSNLVAYLALFVALGGTSYAAVKLPRNSVGSGQLRANSVTGEKVRNGSLLAADFRRGQLPAGAQGVAGLTGPTGPAGAAGPAGQRGPSDAYAALGPAPVSLQPGASVQVTSIVVPAGSYTLAATGFVYPSGAPVGGTDQYICSIVDAENKVLAAMPSQITLTGPQQYVVLGAGEAAAGPLSVRCMQIVFGPGEADPPFTQINARLVATRVATLTSG